MGTLKKGKTTIIATAVVVILCVISQVALVAADAAYQDEFNSTTLQSFWSTVGSNSATYSLTANPGYMRITSPANLDIGGSNDNAPRLIQSVTGDFAAITKVTGTFTAAGTHAGLIVWIDNTHFMRVEVRDVNIVQIGGKNGGVFVFTQATPSPTPNPIYLKLTKSGTTITGSWSNDGSTWHDFGTQTMSGSGAIYVGLFVINQNASPASFNADFDYFHITPASTLSVLPEYPVGIFGATAAIAGAYILFKAKNRIKPISF